MECSRFGTHPKKSASLGHILIFKHQKAKKGPHMKTIHPDMEKLPDIFSKLPMDKPIVMVSLLKFKEIAAYKDGPADYSGRKAYGYYAETLVRH